MALPARRSDDAAHWDPLAELGRLNQQLAGYLDSWRSLPGLLGEGFTPLADVEETDDARVEVELPGVKREDVDVELAGRRLVVAGERKERERTPEAHHERRRVRCADGGAVGERHPPPTSTGPFPAPPGTAAGLGARPPAGVVSRADGPSASGPPGPRTGRGAR